MTEGVDIPPPSEPGRERSIFPITREVAGRSLAEIAANPSDAFLRESLILRGNNQVLARGLNQYFDALIRSGSRYSEREMLEGAFLTHRILRHQAENLGQGLPTITDELWASQEGSRLDTLNRIISAGGPLINMSSGAMREISQDDPEFVAAVNEFVKYRVGQDAVLAGTVETYSAFKRAVEVQRMNRDFREGN